jgi:hypothetical protein
VSRDREGAGSVSSSQPLQLFEGGPLWQLLVRTRLVVPRAMLLRRISVLIALTWLPLVLLALVDGTAFGRVDLPLSRDLVVHVRFLLAVPVLILAEVMLQRSITGVLRYFGMSGVVPPREEPKLVKILETGRRRRDSIAVELALLAIAFGGAALAFSQTRELFLGVSSWRMEPVADGGELTSAGMWHAMISLPVFQFLLLRWLWRLWIWAGVLRGVARLDLGIVASHPDHAGGLGFIGIGQIGFAGFVFAVNAVISASIGEGVLHGVSELAAQRATIVGAIVISLLLVLAPLAVFIGPLSRARAAGRLRYGALASHHGRYFEERWLRSEDPPGEEILEAPDISSLADVQPGFDRVYRMRPLPVGRSELVPIALAAALPYAPLALLVMPLSEILKKLLGALT